MNTGTVYEKSVSWVYNLWRAECKNPQKIYLAENPGTRHITTPGQTSVVETSQVKLWPFNFVPDKIDYKFETQGASSLTYDLKLQSPKRQRFQIFFPLTVVEPEHSKTRFKLQTDVQFSWLKYGS